ncbi:methyltransferase domain-containing protein [Futiania mangrovi]|uniref:Methyltransferase domain-containing protein n=1 Tax=Futiania mangrovi TaxID=2959716 RepID=A0A9J6PH16_9PROT|nr:methyltransferase domain-containing protein [Futiania mangrovii]MCP1337790.1 methyltransferase domain-containing protein [Futiania mangrovii]
MTLQRQPTNPAEVYEHCFVPALFAQWGPVTAAAARIGPGDHVLDVACGTGVLAGAAAERAGPRGTVVGLDVNPQMLAVARASQRPVEWVEAPAEALPFADATFDAVVSQFGLMFFDDRAGALREMRRVARPRGRIAVTVCDNIRHSAGYSAFAQLLDRLFGRGVGDAFRAPFALGDAEVLKRLATEAGLPGAAVARRSGDVSFPSVASLVSTERACAWTLGGILDEGQFEHLLEAAETELAPFAREDGSIVFEMPALILTARMDGP